MVDAAQFGDMTRERGLNDPVAAFKAFTGLNNRLPPERLQTNELAQATNVDLDDSGGVRTRAGFTSVLSGVCHSLWAKNNICLFVQNGQLMQLLQDLTAVPLGITGLEPANPVSYALLGETVYFTNGTITGAFQNGVARSWGLAVPPLPAANLIDGSMPPGTYGFVATYLRNDGQESGAGNIQTIVAPAGQTYGIQWSVQQPADPTVAFIRIYLTVTNGDELYLAAEIPVGTKTATYTGDTSDLTVPIWTLVMGPPPAGQQVAEFNGRLLIAQGQILWYTDPFSPELIRPDQNFLWFESDITMVAPVAEGVFLATQTETVFLEGMDIGKASRLPKASYGAIPGTLAYTDGSLIGEGRFTSKVALWATPQGIVAAGNQGFIKGVMTNLTQNKVSIPNATMGAGVFRQQNGLNQYLSMLQPSSDAQNLFMGDDVTATVIRNGQVVST